MASRLDSPSKWTHKLVNKLFKGAEGKALRADILSYLRSGNPPPGPGYFGAQQLLGQAPGLLQNAIGAQQGMLPMYQQAVQQGLTGNFFDITPMQQFAERELYRNTMPSINQSFASLGTPLSSDFTGQQIGAVRDTYLDLAAQDALMEFQAKQGLVNQGGMGAYANYAQQPANLALSGTGQLNDLDTALRATEMSTRPGAATLFPSFLDSLEGESNIVSRGRMTEGVA